MIRDQRALVQNGNSSSSTVYKLLSLFAHRNHGGITNAGCLINMIGTTVSRSSVGRHVGFTSLDTKVSRLWMAEVRMSCFNSRAGCSFTNKILPCV